MDRPAAVSFDFHTGRYYLCASACCHTRFPQRWVLMRHCGMEMPPLSSFPHSVSLYLGSARTQRASASSLRESPGHASENSA